MWQFLRNPGVNLAVTAIALTALSSTPAWALVTVPGPAAGGIAGAAIIGALVIAKLLRRK